jgi:hypothetical protein
MTGVDRLYVIWSPAAPRARRRHVVGELWRQHDRSFAFAYASDLAAAFGSGFTMLPEFPEHRSTDRPYVSHQLFSTFAQRIPSPKRPDHARILAGWGVDSAHDPLAILAVSGGVQLTDRLELAEYRDQDDDLSRPLQFRVAGEQFHPGAEQLEPNQRVELRREPENAHDGDATQVRVVAGDVIGYVPQQYARLIARHLDAGRELDAVAARRLVLPEDRDRWIVRVQAHHATTHVQAA